MNTKSTMTIRKTLSRILESDSEYDVQYAITDRNTGFTYKILVPDRITPEYKVIVLSDYGMPLHATEHDTLAQAWNSLSIELGMIPPRITTINHVSHSASGSAVECPKCLAMMPAPIHKYDHSIYRCDVCGYVDSPDYSDSQAQEDRES